MQTWLNQGKVSWISLGQVESDCRVLQEPKKERKRRKKFTNINRKREQDGERPKEMLTFWPLHWYPDCEPFRKEEASLNPSFFFRTLEWLYPPCGPWQCRATVQSALHRAWPSGCWKRTAEEAVRLGSGSRWTLCSVDQGFPNFHVPNDHLEA